MTHESDQSGLQTLPDSGALMPLKAGSKVKNGIKPNGAASLNFLAPCDNLTLLALPE